MSWKKEEYLNENLFPNIAELGVFGLGSKFIKSELDTDSKKSVQFASSIEFRKVFVQILRNTCEGENKNDERTFRIVVKFFPDSLKVREMMNSSIQFQNENAMYRNILPFLDFENITSKLFPTFFYGESSEEEGKIPVILVEDLREKKFKISKFKLFLDYEHLVVVLKALGEFHALSYIAKQRTPKEFNKIKTLLKEHVWNRDKSPIVKIIGPCALRGVIPLYEMNKSESLKKLIDRLKTDAVGFIRQIVTPEEPMAVICHGDFCNHNVLFKYDDQNNPSSIKFLDLQTSRYASPIIDLSMILLLNTDHNLRSSHWDEFLSIYYNSMKETVISANCTPPNYDQLVSEFKTKSLYGYFNCSYFLPMMINDLPSPNLEEFSEINDEEILEDVLQIGGEKGTQELTNIVKHLNDLNYFSFLN